MVRENFKAKFSLISNVIIQCSQLGLKYALLGVMMSLFLLGCSKKSSGTPDIQIETPIASDKPNILLIIADDMGWDAFGNYPGALGQKAITPVLDSLAKAGITFSNLWVNPVCSPTRASILTGKYGFRTGIGAAIGPQATGLSSAETAIQSYINTKTNNQYASAVIGKWHVSNVSQLAAPVNFGANYYSGIFTGTVSNYYSWTKTTGGLQSTVNTYTTSYFVDESKQWINQQTKPWFLWLAFNSPHTPFHRPPLNLISDQSLSDNTATIANNPLPYYLAAIEAMDKEIGRLINSMTDAQKKNTLIVFIGDNGTGTQAVQEPYNTSSAKGTLFQGGINTPMIVSGLGVTRKNQLENSLVNGTDLFATIADVAGAGITSIHDSYSIKPLLSESVVFARKYAYSEQFNSGTDGDGWTMRDSKYKLIHLTNGAEYFYDLSLDPFETNNLLVGTLSTEANSALNAIRAEKLKL